LPYDGIVLMRNSKNWKYYFGYFISLVSIPFKNVFK